MVGTRKGAYRFCAARGDAGWSEPFPLLSGWEVSSIGQTRSRSGRLAVGTAHMAYGATVRISDDLGETWTQVLNGPRYSPESGLALSRIWQIVPGHPGEPNTLFAGVDSAGLFMSRDGGETWELNEALTRHDTRPGWTETQAGLFLHSVLIDPGNPLRIWTAISNGGVFRTDDGGETWRPCNAGLPVHSTEEALPELAGGVHKIALDPFDSNSLIMQHCSGVFRSTDAGVSWSAIEKGLPTTGGFALAVSGGGDAYIAPLDQETRCFPDGRLGVYRLRRGSQEWEPVGRGLPDTPHYVGVLRDGLAVYDHESTGVIFGTSQGDLFWLADEDAAWERIPGQFGRISCIAVVRQPNPK
jgi:photosystem II stability/assembly factor-like uncharacterized protein